MTKRNLSLTEEELTELLRELQNVFHKLIVIMRKVEDSIGNLMEKEEILDHRQSNTEQSSYINMECFEGD